MLMTIQAKGKIDVVEVAPKKKYFPKDESRDYLVVVNGKIEAKLKNIDRRIPAFELARLALNKLMEGYKQ